MFRAMREDHPRFRVGLNSSDWCPYMRKERRKGGGAVERDTGGEGQVKTPVKRQGVSGAMLLQTREYPGLPALLTS